MQDKDVYEKFYSKLLAKRLINQTSISNDYEKLMIATIQVQIDFPLIDFRRIFVLNRMPVVSNMYLKSNKCVKISKRVRIFLINIIKLNQ